MNLSRKRPSLLVLGLVLLLTGVMAPAAGAQGLFGPGLSLPFLGGSSAGYCGPAKGCCDPCCPGGLKFDVGYLWNRRAVQIGETAGGDGTIFILSDNRFRYPLEGVQVGATLQAPLKDNFGVMLRGTWLFPTGGRAEEDFLTAPVTLRTRDWSTKSQYYTVEGAGLYPFCAPFNLIAGFRYDSLYTTFKNPDTTLFNGSLRTDKSEITLTSYIPYVGIGINYGQSLRLAFIGTPIYWGDLKIRETVGGLGLDSFEVSSGLRNAYFAEASAEYGMAVGPGTAAVLGKWTYMRGTATPTLKDRFANGGVPIIFEQASSNVNLTRQHFYIGASFTVSLYSPF